MFKVDTQIDKQVDALSNDMEYGFTTSKLDGIAQVKNVTAVVVRNYAPNGASPQVGWMWVDTSTNRVYVSYGTTSVSERALMGTSSVTSVFGRVNSVIATAGDYDAGMITETASRVFVTPAQKTVLSNTSGTNTGDNAANTLYSGLVTNATHTGDVTGATALTIDKTAITGKTAVTAETGVDYMLISDTSDSGNLKKALVTTGGGTGTVTSVAALTLGTTGTDVSSTVATGTTTPVITLQIPTASADNRGALSSTDRSTFNGKASTTSPTFATSINGSYLTASQMLITDASKNIISAAVATYPSLTELAYVKGLTSSAQTQLTAAATKTGSNWTFASQAIGDLAYASSTTAYSRLAAVATGSILASKGTGTAPAWSTTPSVANLVEGFTTTATAAGTTVLTTTSTRQQYFTGSSTQTVTLPTTTVLAGQSYRIVNQSTGSVTVQSSGANSISVILGGQEAMFTALVATPTTAAHWQSTYNINPQLTTIELGHATDTTLSRVSAGVIAVEGVTVPTETSTNTLTNKRINPRIVTAASYTTDTGTSLSVATTDIFVITAQAGALKFNNPGGTPLNGQKLMIRIKDNGTGARALTYDTQFRAIGVTLPTTTVISKTLYIGCVYNSDDTKRDVLAVGQEA